MSTLRYFLLVFLTLPAAIFPGRGSDIKLFKLDAEDVYHLESDLKNGTPGEIGFHLTKARLLGPLYGNKDRALGFLLGYKFACVHWDQNSFFSQEKFHSLEFGINAMYGEFENWNLRGGISTVFDLCNGTVGSSNTQYKAMLWGVYDCSESLEFHIGFLGRMGLLDNRYLPILGLEWKPADDWILSLIFPLKVAVEYLANESWSVILRPRVQMERYRLSASESGSSSRGFVEYRNYGGEVAMQYRQDETWNVKLFGGWCGGGSVKIWDSAGNNGMKRKFDSGPHVGGSGSLRF
jgi:hypothetical protein